MARRRRIRGRNVTGILLLDKQPGLSSNAALQQVKRLFRAAKAGHTGSLDPMASGLLPICLGEATKFSAFLLNADKRYRTEVKLGATTTTGDAEGEVVSRRPVAVADEAAVEQVLARFRGCVTQMPPMYSALKHQGQPLYKLARQGKEVERQPRQVMIHELKLLGLRDDILELEVFCSKGTYIRTLAEDIGEALGCGGHVSALRRLAVGPFRIEEAVDHEALMNLKDAQGLEALDARLLPMEAALQDCPGLNLTDDAAYYLRKGQPVLIPRAPTEGLVRLYQGEGDFLGVGQILDDGRVAPKRLISAA